MSSRAQNATGSSCIGGGKTPDAFPDSPESYSPISLPGFDEEYANHRNEEDEEVVDGGTEIEDAEATKKSEVKADAT